MLRLARNVAVSLRLSPCCHVQDAKIQIYAFVWNAVSLTGTHVLESWPGRLAKRFPQLGKKMMRNALENNVALAKASIQKAAFWKLRRKIPHSAFEPTRMSDPALNAVDTDIKHHTTRFESSTLKV